MGSTFLNRMGKESLSKRVTFEQGPSGVGESEPLSRMEAGFGQQGVRTAGACQQ